MTQLSWEKNKFVTAQLCLIRMEFKKVIVVLNHGKVEKNSVHAIRSQPRFLNSL